MRTLADFARLRRVGKEMGVFTNTVERNELAAGDHIYTWRTFFIYSHHGIYVGESKVAHFTQQKIVSGGPSLFSAPFKCSSASSINVPASSTNVSSTCTIPGCRFQQKESGVVLSCLNCFLGDGRLYCFEYGVSKPIFLSRIRGSTCTTAQSDPPGVVIHRAMYLLQNGFGKYDVLVNNCEDFALYCETGRLDQAAGSSGQAHSAIFAPLSAIVSLVLKLFMSSPPGLVVAAAGMYCFTS